MAAAKGSETALIMALAPKSSAKSKDSEMPEEGAEPEGLEEAEEVLAAMNSGDAAALNDALKAHYARCHSSSKKPTY